ncbi:UNVERIFIED_CONTAM: hypothetical protein NCL1_51000 [Trichonephila clavipes]
MNEDHTTKKVFNAKPIGTRRKNKPNLNWIDGLEKDLLVLRTRDWRTLVGKRLTWKRFLEKVKTLPGLSSHWGKKESFRPRYQQHEKDY